MRLAGKSTLITGAARGIGLAFAKTYVAEGAKVAIADIDEARAHAAALSIGEGAIAVHMDVADQASIDAGVAATADAFGQIDVLINNAAIFSAAPISEVTRQDYTSVFDINVAGTLFTLQAVAEHMIPIGRFELDPAWHQCERHSTRGGGRRSLGWCRCFFCKIRR